MTEQQLVKDRDLPEFGSVQNQGRRKSMEDRLLVRQVETADGMPMTVAMVADGIASTSAGDRAAELAIEVVFQELEAAHVADPALIPILLRMSLEKANLAVYEESREDRAKRNMGSTAVLAAIHDNSLYLANVGDSRAYLIRNDEAIQLTRDHTWARDMIKQGRLDPEEAASHPKAEELVRSIGFDSDLEVDLGVYVNGVESEELASANQGFELLPDDRLLLCSDGLVKSRHNAEGRYIEDSDMVHAVTHRAPQQAAEDLVQKAVKRDVDDNVSVIVVEMPESQRAFYMPPTLLYAGLAVVGLILVAGLVALLIRSGVLGSEETAGVETTVGVTLAIEIPATESTPTLADAAAASESEMPTSLRIQAVASGTSGEVRELDLGSTLNMSNLTGEVAVWELPDGSRLYTAPGSSLELASSKQAILWIVLEQGHLLVTGDEPTRVVNPTGSEARVSGPGGIMGARIAEDGFSFEIHCLGGQFCELRGDLNDSPQVLQPGSAGVVGGNGTAALLDGPARYDLFSILAAIVPTPTATATPTEPPTETPTPTPTNTRRASVVPTLQPTATQRPSGVVPTSQPEPTNTPRPGGPSRPPATQPPPTEPAPTQPPPTQPPPTESPPDFED